MKKSTKKGFTLIELMIVLAIIAILAMVLVPKAGIFKTQSKSAGVYTNVNTVRAYLENKVGDNFIKNDEAAVAAAINTAFTGEGFQNPLSNQNTIVSAVVDDKANAPAVLVVASTTVVKAGDHLGTVIVKYNSTGKTYEVYGIDQGGSPVSTTTIK